jgi:2-dehydropantoate 2-reductase
MNGYVVEQGRKMGVSTPVNADLTDMVREIERGERSIDPDNLKQLMEDNP